MKQYLTKEQYLAYCQQEYTQAERKALKLLAIATPFLTLLAVLSL